MALPGLVRIGTRGSRLALAQTQAVAARIQEKNSKIKIEIATIQTSGDRYRGKDLAQAGGKGLFVKEIEEALASGEIDLAVHSLKDLPGVLPEDLTLACFLKRGDPRDCFLSFKYEKFKDLPPGAVVGTSSPRRRIQIVTQRPDLKIEAIRGNVDTRLKKLKGGEYDALILAAAGLKRLKKEAEIREYFDPDFFIPAVGQGILAVEIKKEREDLGIFLKDILNDAETTQVALAERAFLHTIGGDCYTPLAAHAKVDGPRIRMTGWLSTPDGQRQICLAKSDKTSMGETLGKNLAREILNAIAAHPIA